MNELLMTMNSNLNLLNGIVASIKRRPSDFLTWKRKNVTLRGIKNLGAPNNVYGSFGKGLYTAFLSNRSMANEYGTVYFVVNAIPSKPRVVSNRNEAEILCQEIVSEFCKKHKVERSNQYFEENTSIESEMMARGFDGLIIRGREMVNYTPKNVLYFRTEDQLFDYWSNL